MLLPPLDGREASSPCLGFLLSSAFVRFAFTISANTVSTLLIAPRSLTFHGRRRKTLKVFTEGERAAI